MAQKYSRSSVTNIHLVSSCFLFFLLTTLMTAHRSWPQSYFQDTSGLFLPPAELFTSEEPVVCYFNYEIQFNITQTNKIWVLKIFYFLKTRPMALKSLNKEDSLGKNDCKKKSASKITLKPPNCLTLIQQIRIFSKKPLEGSSGLDNSFFWSKDTLNNYFLFVTNSTWCYWATRFFSKLHGKFEGCALQERGGWAATRSLHSEGGRLAHSGVLPAQLFIRILFLCLRCIWIPEQTPRPRHCLLESSVGFLLSLASAGGLGSGSGVRKSSQEQPALRGRGLKPKLEALLYQSPWRKLVRCSAFNEPTNDA